MALSQVDRQVGDAIDAIFYALGIIVGLTVNEET